MGQCYSVTYKLNPKTTEDEIVKRLNNYIDDEENTGRTHWNYDDCLDRNSLDELMKLLIPPRAIYKRDDGYYSGDFDASYGWFDLMYTAFKKMIPALDEDSYVEIYPDSGCYKLEVHDDYITEYITQEEMYGLDEYED